MLFRGQNILGYRPYADDVVDSFVEKSIANGIDIIRKGTSRPAISLIQMESAPISSIFFAMPVQYSIV